MKIYIALCSVLVLSTAVLGQGKMTLKDFSQMAGCWASKIKASETQQTEQWTAPAGTSLLGMAHTVSRGKTHAYEFMRIEQRSDGIYFIARPSSNPSDTEFKLVSSTPGEFTFENKQHDFPQRVIYRTGRDTLTGRIEGTTDGKTMGIDFPMIRVKCN